VRVLSVDLGTSNTVAVLSAHGRPPRVVDIDGASMIPSAVFATDDGSLVAGREADRRARLDPARFEPNPKRRVDEGTLLLGDKVIPVTDALAAVLRKVITETTRQLDGSAPDEVRLTHPAQWGPVRRNVLLSAARQAGMGSNLVLVPEPVAAAAHFASFPGRSLTPGQALAVYDLGAGTFDVAVVGATQNGYVVLAEAGLPDLGGLDVDQALLQHVGQQVATRDPGLWQRLLVPSSTVDRRAARALREDVRAAKEALSSHPQTDLPLPEPFDDVMVTRAELESLIRPNLVRSVELLASTIRTTGTTPDRLVGIYLVGGSSRIPLIATLISEHLRLVPTSLDQPETAVALGAQHMSAEGARLRTQDLNSTLAEARAEAPADGRTVAMASPPRPPTPPPPGPQPMRPPHTAPQPVPVAMPQQPMGYAQPVFPPPMAPPPRRNNKPLIIGLVLVVALALGIGGALLLTSGNDGGGQQAANTNTNSPTQGQNDEPQPNDPADSRVQNRKKVSRDHGCKGLLTVADVAAAYGTQATAASDCQIQVQVNDRGIQGGVYVGMSPGLSDPDPCVSSSPCDKTTFEGNQAYVRNDPNTHACDMFVAAVPEGDPEWQQGMKLFLLVTAYNLDACEVARTLAKTAFDRLPDA
jgi:actin-like ATPase involved in cell morphogenesis